MTTIRTAMMAAALFFPALQASALTGQQEQEIAALDQSAAIARWEQGVPDRVADAVGQARAHALLGRRWEAVEEYSAAFNSYDAAVGLLEPLGPSAGLVDALIDRSYIIYSLTGDPGRYCPDRRRAVDVARALGQPEPLVNALVSRVFCYRSADEVTLGMADVDEALAIASEAGLANDLRGMISNASGNLLRSNMLHDLAYEAYARAYQSWHEIGDTADTFNMLHALTGEALQLGRWEVAEQHIAEMFRLADAPDAGGDFMFFAFFNEGRVALARADLQLAGEALDHALALRHTTEENYFVARAYVLRTFQRIWEGEPAAAAADLAAAKAIGVLDDPNLEIAGSLVKALARVEDPQSLAAPMVSLIQQLREQQRHFMDRNARAASGHQERQIAVHESQLLKQQIEMQALELSRAEGEASLARQTAVSAGLLIALLIVSLVVFVRSWRRQRARAHTDYLTGIPNRARVFQLGLREAARAARTGQPLAVILLDIDHFKSINDAHGHGVGDQAIRCTAQAIQGALADGEVLGRLGGEEFLVLTPRTTLEQARIRAQRLLDTVEELSIMPPGERPLTLTLSAGVDVAKGPDLDFESLVHRADGALYLAKSRGRNRVETSVELSLSNGTRGPRREERARASVTRAAARS